MTDGTQGRKCIALAGRVSFALEQGKQEIGGIGDEMVKMRVYRGHCPDCVLANVGVSVFEASAGGRDERFEKLWFAELAQKAEGCSPDVFVGMLQVISDTITAKKEE